jgi:hypothetical protein
MKKFTLIAVSGFFMLLFSLQGYGQDEKRSNLDVGSDFVSRYIWRGADFGNSPSIQPFISYSIAGFEIGTWGSFAINGADMQEVDLYASYTFLQDIISIGVTDYFFPSSTVTMNNYFDYSDESTGHIFEGNLNLSGPEKVPLSLSVNYNFYGADNNNSWYFELGYANSCKYIDYNVFVGATTGEGIYLTPDADGFSVVNIGLGVSKEIKITEKWSLPVFGQLITNPQAQNIFLVFGFSL